MRILITGNMGYIGPSVVQRLRATYPGATLMGYDMGYFAQCLTHAAYLPECRVDVQHFGDVRNFPEDLLPGVDAVVHLAAISNDPMGKAYEEITLDVNYRSSVRIAEMAKAAGVGAFVFASSCSVYGAAGEGPRTEDSPVNPLTAYAKSKVFTENGLKPLADKNFKVTALRFSTACGMSERLRLDLVVNDFVASAVATKKIVILSDGTPWRPLINIKDMARAMDWAILRDPAEGGDFLAVNIGSKEWNYQIRDLAEAVARVIPGTEVSINPDAQPDKRSYQVDFSLFNRLAPGHQVQYDLLTTVTDLKEGLEAMEFNDPDFRDSPFMRLKMLSKLESSGCLGPDLEWKFDRRRVSAAL
ncbi:MAG: NAD-dependent epimerase/dehydratase family protein [Nitrospinaceae bacterium]